MSGYTPSPWHITPDARIRLGLWQTGHRSIVPAVGHNVAQWMFDRDLRRTCGTACEITNQIAQARCVRRIWLSCTVILRAAVAIAKGEGA